MSGKIAWFACVVLVLSLQAGYSATLFYDDFSTGVDPATYYTEGSPLASGGTVTLPAANAGVAHCVQTLQTFSYTATEPITYSARVRWTSYSPSAGQWFGWTRLGGAWPETYTFGCHWAFGWFCAESNGAMQSTALDSSTILEWHDYSVSATEAELKYYVDGSLVATHTSASAWPFSDCHAGIMVVEGNDGLEIDWLKVTNEPVVPEPASLVALLSGIGAIGGLRLRRRA